jgi:hypothetical protein
VGHRDGVGAGGVDLRVDDEAGRVDPSGAFQHGAVGVDQQQVTDFEVSEVHRERIDPEAVGVFGVAGGDVTAGALVEAVPGEQAQCGGEVPFAVLPFLVDAARRTGVHPQPPAVSVS